MSRLSRKNKTEDELGIKSSGGMFDLFDNQVKLTYRLTDKEYDKLAGDMTDEEMDIFLKDQLTFGEKRKLLQIYNKYLK